MKQSRVMSLVEATANVVVGYGVAVLTQLLVFPLFGLHTTLAENLMIGAIFTVVSIARSFALRRLFEAIRVANRCGGHAGHEEPAPPRR
jgi:cobalamin biosynthesis protein CobD/CbiB